MRNSEIKRKKNYLSVVSASSKSKSKKKPIDTFSTGQTKTFLSKMGDGDLSSNTKRKTLNSPRKEMRR